MTGDVIRDEAALFLGSRFKRLGERMQADVARVSETLGLAVQPAQYPLLATIDRDGPQTIGALVDAMALSQPSVTRTVATLVEAGLVAVTRAGRDQRRKTVALTPSGAAAVARAKAVLWPAVEAAVRGLVADLPDGLFPGLAALEDRLAERTLARRAGDHRPRLSIRRYEDALAPRFRAINAEWIEAMFTLEPTDREVLDDPRGRILDPGGDVLFVEAEGLGVIGTCALQKTGERRFELTKMGVAAGARGLKAGEFLLAAVIARAAELGAERLYLLSNRKAAAAIHLYEKLGFVHDEGVMAEFGRRYARCDVAMLYRPAGADTGGAGGPQREAIGT